MNTLESRRPDEDDDDKLVPGWGASADEQIVWAGLAVVAALALLFGWNAFFGSDDEPADVEVVADDLTDALIEPGEAVAGAAAAAPVLAGIDDDADSDSANDAGVENEEENLEEEVASSTTTEAEPVTVDQAAVDAALSPLAGDMVGTVDGTTVTLTGYVANAAEEAEAVAAVESVANVEAVINELQILEPPVVSALQASGVVNSGASGIGTVMTLTGVVQSEEARVEALEAAAAVPGVTSVVDNLEVSVAADLNQLEEVPFATNSAEILAEGDAIIAEAAELIIAAGDVKLDVQGYTDVRGNDSFNLQLSQDRASAVADALIAAGVDPSVLSATGYGETEQFAAGDTPEALAANRVVRFVEVN